MIDLNKEAKHYAFEFSIDYKPWEEDLHYKKYAEYGFEKGFIAGVNSKYVQQQILQAQIDIINSLFELGLKNVHQTMNTPVEIYNDVINPLKKDLEQKLKELENE